MASSYQLRVIEERNSLDARRSKMYRFTQSPAYDQISQAEKDMLEVQRQVMRSYSTILSLRIAAFMLENSNETPIADTAEADKGMAEA